MQNISYTGTKHTKTERIYIPLYFTSLVSRKDNYRVARTEKIIFQLRQFCTSKVILYRVFSAGLIFSVNLSCFMQGRWFVHFTVSKLKNSDCTLMKNDFYKSLFLKHNRNKSIKRIV